MDLYLICARFDEDHHEVLEAWSEWDIEANSEGFKDALEQAKKGHTEAEIRTAIVEVPDNFFDQVFEPTRTKGKPRRTE